jgi:hypothetical protein
VFKRPLYPESGVLSYPNFVRKFGWLNLIFPGFTKPGFLPPHMPGV